MRRIALAGSPEAGRVSAAGISQPETIRVRGCSRVESVTPTYFARAAPSASIFAIATES
jgi:hypothetical protein